MRLQMIGIGDRVVDPKTGERGVVVDFQEANLPWHNGGCPIVEPDTDWAKRNMGRYWHEAISEMEAVDCGTCGGVVFTPSCTSQKHIEAAYVDRIYGFMIDQGEFGMAEKVKSKFHPKLRKY